MVLATTVVVGSSQSHYNILVAMNPTVLLKRTQLNDGMQQVDYSVTVRV